MLFSLVFMGGTIMAGILTKKVHFLYYPMLEMNLITVWSVIVYCFYGVLCLLPVILDIVEDIKASFENQQI